MKYLVLINGKPRSGKDTFTNYCLDIVKGESYSSIDPAAKAGLIAGYNYYVDEVKSDHDRSFLSEQKMLFDKYYNTSFEYIVNLVENFHTQGDLIFYHVREIENIETLKDYFSKYKLDVKCISLYINNDSITHIPTNVGDMSTLLDYKYDYTISNDGTLVDLSEKASQFVETLMYK